VNRPRKGKGDSEGVSLDPVWDQSPLLKAKSPFICCLTSCLPLQQVPAQSPSPKIRRRGPFALVVCQALCLTKRAVWLGGLGAAAIAASRTQRGGRWVAAAETAVVPRVAAAAGRFRRQPMTCPLAAAEQTVTTDCV
jgi:hypothetical protein